jgi:hypothetical protein
MKNYFFRTRIQNEILPDFMRPDILNPEYNEETAPGTIIQNNPINRNNI